MKTGTLAPKLTDLYVQTERLIFLANSVLLPNQKRFGGYLTILDAQDGKLLLVLACGVVPLEKAEKYRRLSLEKAQRVFENKEHNTSWDTQDEANAKYPGAIRGTEAIYSFSGQKPDVDEAISVSMFYLLEPAELGARCNCEATKKLFLYYYDEVSKRNEFIKPFLKNTVLNYGNSFLQSLIK